jgi:formylglycine-generating enzyme required for sulfatase activity/dienelactone hydrolase
MSARTGEAMDQPIAKRTLFLLAVLLGTPLAQAADAQPPAPRVLDLKAQDGTLLKATYYAAGRPGPGVLLFHQSNRTRASWNDLAARLAAAGIHALSVDSRGHGESGGAHDSREAKQRYRAGDLEAAFQGLVSEPGVAREVIGMAGAGSLGVDNAVETARGHSGSAKSLVLLSGETLRPQLQFLHEASQLPALFVFSDEDEYPPTQEAMQLLYATSSSPGKRLVHYPAVEEAPWLWYETSEVDRVPARGGHGTDLFERHEELPAIIVRRFVTTLITTPGHAPADPIAAAPILNQVAWADDVSGASRQLMRARQSDPRAELWPEISMSIIGQDLLRAGEPMRAVPVLELNLLAYPDSADAQETLGEAYLADGQREPARRCAEKALALLEAHTLPASSWTDTEPYRGEIREGALRILKKLEQAAGATHAEAPGRVFRDCPDCPEMVVIPAGRFAMGSSAADQSWAASHGGNKASVADEAPQHDVSLRSFALGRNDVTRGEYAAFVAETGHPAGDGCGPDSFKWNKRPGVSWEAPGFAQTDRDPVVCVSWHDARAYVAWLNGKLRKLGSADGPYRLPSESEWEYAARAGTTTRFGWGDDLTQASDHAWYKDNSAGVTHPLGQKPPNAFGLHDIVGNVWQWTEDCYAESYASAPTNGSPAEGPDTCLRVDRGGSFLYPGWLLRSATRERNPADYRDSIMGFRLARSLP